MNEGKYFFNGKDITMNICIQIWDVIDIIQEYSCLYHVLQGLISSMYVVGSDDINL